MDCYLSSFITYVPGSSYPQYLYESLTRYLEPYSLYIDGRSLFKTELQKDNFQELINYPLFWCIYGRSPKEYPGLSLLQHLYTLPKVEKKDAEDIRLAVRELNWVVMPWGSKGEFLLTITADNNAYLNLFDQITRGIFERNDLHRSVVFPHIGKVIITHELDDFPFQNIKFCSLEGGYELHEFAFDLLSEGGDFKLFAFKEGVIGFRNGSKLGKSEFLDILMKSAAEDTLLIALDSEATDRVASEVIHLINEYNPISDVYYTPEILQMTNRCMLFGSGEEDRKALSIFDADQNRLVHAYGRLNVDGREYIQATLIA
jgi:hypothetical protein